MMTLGTRQYNTTDVREWAQEGHLYAILDSCDTPSVPEKVESLGPSRAVSLFRGTAETELSIIAPYLVSVDVALFEWITGALWSEPWGIFLQSDCQLDALRRHFRKFLIVDSPGGEQWYFRFYDPRILSRYLTTCTENELIDFFWLIWCFAISDADTYGITQFARERLPEDASDAKIKVVFRR